MTSRLGRRQFLRRFAGAGTIMVALGALEACAGASQASGPTSSSTPSQAAQSPAAEPPPTVADAAKARPSPQPTPASLPDVVVVKGEGPGAVTEAAITAIGGIDRFVKPGNGVISTHSNFTQRLPDLLSVLTPTLTVIDATRVMIGNGPAGGRPDDLLVMNTVVVSTDTVAADAYATRFWGLKPKEVPHIKTAAEMGLGVMDVKKLRVAELEV